MIHYLFFAEPNIYPFGTSYEEIYKDLVKKDRQLYTGTSLFDLLCTCIFLSSVMISFLFFLFFLTENGMLPILDRNMRIKHKPEKFQESDKLYDVILTCEERVYDLVIEKFEDSGSVHSRLAHVVNIDVVKLMLGNACLPCNLLSLCRLTTWKMQP